MNNVVSLEVHRRSRRVPLEARARLDEIEARYDAMMDEFKRHYEAASLLLEAEMAVKLTIALSNRENELQQFWLELKKDRDWRE